MEQHMVEDSYLRMMIWKHTVCKILNYSISKGYTEMLLLQLRRKACHLCYKNAQPLAIHCAFVYSFHLCERTFLNFAI